MRRWYITSCAVLFCLVKVGFLSAQVFTQADGAVVGYTPEGQGQGLYGGLGLDSATAPEFNIYRKFTEVTDQTPQAVATNVEGNSGEIEWSGINQRAGFTEGITAPGMFIGTTNRVNADGWVTTDPNQLFYFKGQFDNTGTAGTTDSNKRTQWDTRFGFMEKPGDYIDFVEPNSSQLDLWTGQYNTDAVYTGNIIRGDDSAADTNIQQQHTGGGSFKLQSGDPLTEIIDERDRTNRPMIRTRAGSGEELADAGSLQDTGVAYEDAVEVSWGMRLNDPDNSNPDFAREVLFWVKTGNLISSGIFDPGDEDNFAFEVPNPGSDPSSDFTDNFFDWRSAIPVFFAGGQGNIGDGTGSMGIFIPGDYGANGLVDLDDFNRLAANYGDLDTTYSRGDQTQDGVTNEADAAAWASVAGDDAKSAAIAAVSADVDAGGSAYDFDGNGSTDAGDLSFITDLFGVVSGCVAPNELAGDLDGNGEVAFADFLVLSANFGQTVATYAEGDVDCDGQVGFPDFLALSANFGETIGGVAAVPEPAHGAILLLGGMLLAFASRPFGRGR